MKGSSDALVPPHKEDQVILNTKIQGERQMSRTLEAFLPKRQKRGEYNPHVASRGSCGLVSMNRRCAKRHAELFYFAYLFKRRGKFFWLGKEDDHGPRNRGKWSGHRSHVAAEYHILV